MTGIVFDNSISQQAWGYCERIKMSDQPHDWNGQFAHCFRSFVQTYFEAEHIIATSPGKPPGLTDPFLSLIHTEHFATPKEKAQEDDITMMTAFEKSLLMNKGRWVDFLTFQLLSPTHTRDGKLVHNDYIFNQYASRVPAWDKELAKTMGHLKDGALAERLPPDIDTALSAIFEEFFDISNDRLRAQNVLYSNYLKGARHSEDRRDFALAFAYSWFVRGKTYGNLAKEQIFERKSPFSPTFGLHELRGDAVVPIGSNSKHYRSHSFRPPWDYLIEEVIRNGAFDDKYDSLDQNKLVEFIATLRHEYRTENTENKFKALDNQWAEATTNKDIEQAKADRRRLLCDVLFRAGLKPKITEGMEFWTRVIANLGVVAVALPFLETKVQIEAGTAGLVFAKEAIAGALRQETFISRQSRRLTKAIKRNVTIGAYENVRAVAGNAWFYHVFYYPELISMDTLK